MRMALEFSKRLRSPERITYKSVQLRTKLGSFVAACFAGNLDDVCTDGDSYVLFSDQGDESCSALH